MCTVAPYLRSGTLNTSTGFTITCITMEAQDRVSDMQIRAFGEFGGARHAMLLYCIDAGDAVHKPFAFVPRSKSLDRDQHNIYR